MAVRIRLPDGREVDFQTDDPKAASIAAKKLLAKEAESQRSLALENAGRDRPVNQVPQRAERPPNPVVGAIQGAREALGDASERPNIPGPAGRAIQGAAAIGAGLIDTGEALGRGARQFVGDFARDPVAATGQAAKDVVFGTAESVNSIGPALLAPGRVLTGERTPQEGLAEIGRGAIGALDVATIASPTPPAAQIARQAQRGARREAIDKTIQQRPNDRFLELANKYDINPIMAQTSAPFADSITRLVANFPIIGDAAKDRLKEANNHAQVRLSERLSTVTARNGFGDAGTGPRDAGRAIIEASKRHLTDRVQTEFVAGELRPIPGASKNATFKDVFDKRYARVFKRIDTNQAVLPERTAALLRENANQSGNIRVADLLEETGASEVDDIVRDQINDIDRALRRVGGGPLGGFERQLLDEATDRARRASEVARNADELGSSINEIVNDFDVGPQRPDLPAFTSILNPFVDNAGQAGRNLADEARRVQGEQFPLVPSAQLDRAKQLTIDDMIKLRRFVRARRREVASNKNNTQTNRFFARLDGALTEDIHNAIRRQEGGEFSARLLANVDRDYGQQLAKVKRALSPFMPSDRQNFSPEEAYQQIVRSSLRENFKGANADRIRILRRALNEGEMDDVAAGIVQTMGKVTRNRGDIQIDGWSAEQFAINFEKMSPDARRAIFGRERRGRDPLKEIEEIAELSRNVAQSEATQRSVDQGRGSLVGAGLTFSGATGAAFNPSLIPSFLLTAATAKYMGRLMTSPQFTRGYIRFMRAKDRTTRQLFQRQFGDFGPDIPYSKEQMAFLLAAAQTAKSDDAAATPASDALLAAAIVQSGIRTEDMEAFLAGFEGSN